jgi:hypothetical protein
MFLFTGFARVTCVQASEEAPYLEDVQPLLLRAETMNVKVPHLVTLESQVATTTKWVSRLHRVMSPRSCVTLVEVSHRTGSSRTRNTQLKKK